MREQTDHHDAELLLRLYDLRREERLREARDLMVELDVLKSKQPVSAVPQAAAPVSPAAQDVVLAN